ncbi:MAG: tryptophan-rich sensory protein [Saprospiraceae bacterium]
MRILPIANALGFVAVIAANWAANALPLNGYNTGQLSDFYPNYFVPAGYAFSIWGLIYLLALAFVVYGFMSDKDASQSGNTTSPPPAVQRIGWKWVMICAINVGWIFAWHYRFVEVSVVLMLAYLCTLSFIFLSLRENNATQPASTKEAWLAWLPFGIHLGWICVATVANFTTLLVDYDISFGAQTDVIVSMGMITVVMFLALFFIRAWGSGEVAAVVAWACIAIAVRHWEGENSLAIVALAAASLIILRIFSGWKSQWFGRSRGVA